MPRKSLNLAEMNVAIDPELYRRFRAYSSFAGLSMRRMLESLIEEGVPELRTVDPGQASARHAA